MHQTPVVPCGDLADLPEFLKYLVTFTNSAPEVYSSGAPRVRLDAPRMVFARACVWEILESMEAEVETVSRPPGHMHSELEIAAYWDGVEQQAASIMRSLCCLEMEVRERSKRNADSLGKPPKRVLERLLLLTRAGMTTTNRPDADSGLLYNTLWFDYMMQGKRASLYSMLFENSLATLHVDLCPWMHVASYPRMALCMTD